MGLSHPLLIPICRLPATRMAMSFRSGYRHLHALTVGSQGGPGLKRSLCRSRLAPHQHSPGSLHVASGCHPPAPPTTMHVRSSAWTLGMATALTKYRAWRRSVTCCAHLCCQPMLNCRQALCRVLPPLNRGRLLSSRLWTHYRCDKHPWTPNLVRSVLTVPPAADQVGQDAPVGFSVCGKWREERRPGSCR